MMNSNSDYITRLVQRLRVFRKEAGLSSEQVEQKLVLGPGWIEAIEGGTVQPGLDVVAAILSVYGRNLSDLVDGISGNVAHIKRPIFPVTAGTDLDIHFAYAGHDAVYRLANASSDQFGEVLLILRNGLAQLGGLHIGREQKSIKTESVAAAFLKAVKL